MAVSASLFERRAVYVFIINVRSGAFSHGYEPLRTIGRHPDDVAGSNRVPVGIKPINALAFEHHKPMFHDVGFDEWQGRSRLVSENVYRQIELRFIRQQYLKARVFVSKKRLARHILLVAHKQSWFGRAR